MISQKLLAFLYLIHTSLSMVHTTHVFHKASPLCFEESSPTKVHGFGTLTLVTLFWNTSFTNLLEYLPSQLEIAGLLQSSTPSCEDSQVNLTWLKYLHYMYLLLVYGIHKYPYTGLKPKVLLPHIYSLHHLTSSYYNFRWLQFNMTTLVCFFQ
jgi:hypothetical protein